MGYLKSQNELVRKLEEIKEDINKLQFYDWNEILDFVPDSDDLREELDDIFSRMENGLREIEELL